MLSRPFLIAGVAGAMAVPLFRADVSRRPAPIRSEGLVTADDGAKLFYTIVGTGPDTLLAPPAAYLRDDYGPLQRGRTVVFYDPRGRGNSEPITDSTRLGFYKDVSDMEAVRRALKLDRMAILGWSYFGGVVAAYASEHPEHVTRIIQVGPIAPRSNGGWVDDRHLRPQVDTSALRKLSQVRSSLRTAQDSLNYCRLDVRFRALPPLVADTGVIGRMRTDPCRYQNENPERWRRNVGLALKELGNPYDLRPRAERVKVPVLIVWGDHDPAPEGAAREWLQSFSEARLLIIRGAGHVPWLEHPEEFFPATDAFLRGVWPSQAEGAR